MREKYQIFYRVETNYGSKYFATEEKAKDYFFDKLNENADVELWKVVFTYGKLDLKHAEQHLMAYAGNCLDKV
jgi:hypothetical protein